MLGPASTGKTSLSERYITGIFNPDIRLTVGVDFYVKTVHFGDKKIKLQIWDMGGEERFRFLLPTYALGLMGALFLFDVTRQETLKDIEEWLTIVRAKNGDVPILLVGNKVDLKDRRQISPEEGKEVCQKNKLAGYIETSAKTGYNVEETFKKLTELMLKNIGV